MSVLIVGGGHAAGQAAASLRQAGYSGAVAILGEEPHVPYQRPPLSKQYLADEYGVEKVYLRPARFYENKDITLRHVRVEAVDAQAQRIACADGETLAYDKLLLATGARPRRLNAAGSELPGIHYLRTLDDVDAIKADFRPGRRLAIVGGGYIGLEVAAVAVQLGMKTTVLEMEARILQRVATTAMSTFYHDLHTSKGVDIRTGVKVESFAGEDRLRGAQCADGTFVEADLAVVGVGVVPNIELAQAAGLPCDDGILVDERACTADANIYAAGDCTNHPNGLLGRRLRLESVPNAMEQARVAVANMLGDTATYESMPWFWSDQYDLKLQMVGYPSDRHQCIVRGDPASHRFASFYFDGDMLVAADAVNSAREFMAARRLVGQRIAAPERIGDSATDLKALM